MILNDAFWVFAAIYGLFGLYFGSLRKGDNPARLERSIHFWMAFAVIAVLGLLLPHWIPDAVGAIGGLLTLWRVSRIPTPLKVKPQPRFTGYTR